MRVGPEIVAAKLHLRPVSGLPALSGRTQPFGDEFPDGQRRSEAGTFHAEQRHQAIDAVLGRRMNGEVGDRLAGTLDLGRTPTLSGCSAPEGRPGQ